ncbi:MAG: hypothetical protein GY853_13855 [PVC group bacterium]|nr:hypothetical protein [PVC group bacterium]
MKDSKSNKASFAKSKVAGQKPVTPAQKGTIDLSTITDIDKIKSMILDILDQVKLLQQQEQMLRNRAVQLMGK